MVVQVISQNSEGRSDVDDRTTIVEVRAALAGGDVNAARSAFDRLKSSAELQPTAILAEAWLLRSEGDLDQARGRADELLKVLSKQFDNKALQELPGLLSDLGCNARAWGDLAATYDRWEFDLDPWRLALARLRVLIALNWRRRALSHAAKAYTDGFLRTDQAVAFLLEVEAFSIAASFIAHLRMEDPWREWARGKVLAAIARTPEPTEDPGDLVHYSDALLARSILFPNDAELSRQMELSRDHLAARAAECLSTGEAAQATRLLVVATQLAEPDQRLLESLAEASRRAGLRERYHDTLMRLWSAHRDIDALTSSLSGLLENAHWPDVVDFMTVALREAGQLGLDVSELSNRFRDQACRRLEECIENRQVMSGLELVVALGKLMPISEWPKALIDRLVRAAKRRMRGHKQTETSQTTRLGLAYLKLDPDDLDVRRMLARAVARQKRLAEAKELLEGILKIDPHCAVDWVALAMIHHELGSRNSRDFCTVRALVISPNSPLPQPLVAIRNRLLPA